MLIQDRQIIGSGVLLPRAAGLREFFTRPDRLPQDQRVDLPEIQESFRVSFSEEALAAAYEETRDTTQKTRPSDEPEANEFRMRAYRDMAAL